MQTFVRVSCVLNMQDRLIFARTVENSRGLCCARIDVEPPDARSGVSLVVAGEGDRTACHDGLRSGGVEQPRRVCTTLIKASEEKS